ncbi:MAG: hypothetical protein Ta2E_00590 [Mycoplasmoidaceae bacterium]|nr:MAG: hypothetical protein Ta2E_00590 [Mycoplasmoidaceae bacterium]
MPKRKRSRKQTPKVMRIEIEIRPIDKIKENIPFYDENHEIDKINEKVN